MNKIRRYSLKGVDIVEKFAVIGRGRLSGKNRYSFCPDCYKTIGEDKSALSPLVVLNYLIEQTANNTQYKTFEKKFYCERCRKTWNRTSLEDCYIAKVDA